MSSHSAELHAWRFPVAERSAAITIDTHARLNTSDDAPVHGDGLDPSGTAGSRRLSAGRGRG